jgi:hypothetical protein
MAATASAPCALIAAIARRTDLALRSAVILRSGRTIRGTGSWRALACLSWRRISNDPKTKAFRHPNSQSGSFGANIKLLGGIERIYSFNAGDPLHPGNLPSWCGVKAIDAVDATIILEFGGDRTRALRDLAERYGLTKTQERRAVAGLIFRLIDEQAAQADIEAAAFAEGQRVGLSIAEVVEVAR